MHLRTGFLGALLVLALGFSADAYAQEIAAFGSYYNVDNSSSNSWGAGGYLGLPTLTIGPVALMLEGRGGYLWDVAGSDSKVNLVPLEAGLSLVLFRNESFSPYVGGGVGAYIFDAQNPNIAVEDRAGWYLVGGTDIALSENWAIKIEALWRDTTGTVDFSEHSYTTSRTEIQGLGVNAGLALRF